jgi:hypothetical protein
MHSLILFFLFVLCCARVYADWKFQAVNHNATSSKLKGGVRIIPSVFAEGKEVKRKQTMLCTKKETCFITYFLSRLYVFVMCV